jgi:galactitol-specific phosphotransferase system IIC component
MTRLYIAVKIVITILTNITLNNMRLTENVPVQKWEKWGYRLFILASVLWQAIQQLIDKW